MGVKRGLAEGRGPGEEGGLSSYLAAIMEYFAAKCERLLIIEIVRG